MDDSGARSFRGTFRLWRAILPVAVERQTALERLSATSSSERPDARHRWAFWHARLDRALRRQGRRGRAPSSVLLSAGTLRPAPEQRYLAVGFWRLAGAGSPLAWVSARMWRSARRCRSQL